MLIRPKPATDALGPHVLVTYTTQFSASGWKDLNLRLPGSRPGALTKLSYNLIEGFFRPPPKRYLNRTVASEWQDLNLRPPASRAGTLTKLRYTLICRCTLFNVATESD